MSNLLLILLLLQSIILGNEHQGVSEFSLKYADENIHIPMFGLIESLNVSVAAAVILYEALRQRLDNNQYPNDILDDKWKDKVLKKWIEN